MMHAPFTVQNAGQPPQNIKAPAELGDERTAMARQLRRKEIFSGIEGGFNDSAFPHLKSVADRETAGSAAQAHASVYAKAFDLTVSPLRTVFEVSKEPANVISAYGGMQNPFGMGCLLARKLIEQGVSCVEVDLGGWDNHNQIFSALRGSGMRPGLAGQLDRGMGTLVKELVDRGRWKNTVVVWMGEFGRTPRINQNGGRDHWGRCWSVVVGGGAIKGGIVHGSTSSDGMDVDKDPVRVGDLFATLFKGLGVDPHTKVRDNLGRPLEIAEGKPISTLV
jgi:uncharacterized protein (DUF1501 family)